MASDTIERLRALALVGLAAPEPVRVLVRRRLRPDPGPPPVPPGTVAPSREELPGLLLDEAAREWRRSTRPWALPLGALRALNVEVVRVAGRSIDVLLRNGVQRARGVAPAWLPVVVAALTGRELVAVRRALRRGVTEFAPEAADG